MMPQTTITVTLGVGAQAAAVKCMISEGIKFFQDAMPYLEVNKPKDQIEWLKKAMASAKEFSDQIDDKVTQFEIEAKAAHLILLSQSVT